MLILSEIKQRVTESMGLLVINKRMRKCRQTKVGTETWVDGGMLERTPHRKHPFLAAWRLPSLRLSRCSRIRSHGPPLEPFYPSCPADSGMRTD